MKSPARSHQPKTTSVCYWTEMHGGRVLMTMDPPVIAPFKRTKTLDAYCVEGEHLDVRLCQFGTRRAINSHRTKKILPPLVPVRVRVTIEVIDEHLLVDSDLH